MLAGSYGALKALPWVVGIGLLMYVLSRSSDPTGEEQPLYNVATWVLAAGVWAGFCWGSGCYMRAVAPSLFEQHRIDKIGVATAAKCCLIGAVSGTLLSLVLNGLASALAVHLGVSRPQGDPRWTLALGGFIVTPVMMFVLPNIGGQDSAERPEEGDKARGEDVGASKE